MIQHSNHAVEIVNRVLGGNLVETELPCSQVQLTTRANKEMASKANSQASLFTFLDSHTSILSLIKERKGSNSFFTSREEILNILQRQILGVRPCKRMEDPLCKLYESKYET